MRGYTNLHAAFPGCFDNQSRGVLLRTHLGRVERVDDLGIPHSEAVMMDSHGGDVFHAGFLQQLDHALGIELFGTHQRNEVFVAELFGFAVPFLV